MTENDEPVRTQAPGYAWISLAAIGGLLVVNMVALAIAPGYTARFELKTGAAWAEFSAQYPGVGRSLRTTEALFYVAYTGMALFAVGLSLFAFRNATRWSWYFMWILTAALLLTAFILGGFQELGVSTFYGVLGLVAGVVLLVSLRVFLPRRG